MRTEGISTLSMSLLNRTAVSSLQRQLAAAQVELASNRHADMGLTLGARTATDIDWRTELAESSQLTGRLKLAATAAEVTQTTMTSITDVITRLSDVLSGARGAANGPALAREAARGALESVTALLNTSFDGQSLFGGINSGTVPINSYEDGPAKTAVDAAFVAEFTFAQTSPAIAGISSTALADFLAGDFHALFNGTNWAANWSNASNELPWVRLDTAQVTRPAVSANLAAFRQLAEAVTMAAEFSQDGMGQSAFQAVVDTSLSLLAEARLGVGAEQSRAGLAQSQIATAIDKLSLRQKALTTSITGLESVDPYETATRINGLMTQLESSYSITGRLRSLSLLNFI